MSKKLWGGRFTKKTSPLVEKFTKSLHYDKKLAEYDVMGSLEHVRVLKSAGYLDTKEAIKVKKGLEDIHTLIQNQLQAKIGNVALKLHTARSRNDQVAYATKLYCRANIRLAQKDIEKLSAALKSRGAKAKTLIIPGFTHMQHAQPVLLKDYFGAYAQMLKRDKARLESALKNMNITMGAGALAGTPIKASHYKSPTANSLDSVSDRDFVLEILSALAILGMHASRLAEDLIIWSTKEFSFIEVDEAFCTGSSLMPQKKNPDALELIRGYAGRLYGNLVSVLTMMKGLPLAYNRDMQLDKEPLFNSFEVVSQELKILSGIIKTLKFNKQAIKQHLKDESLYATDIVYYLVGKGVAFKTAHDIVGKLVKHSIKAGKKIKDMSDEELKKFSNKLKQKDVSKLIDPVRSVRSKKSINRKKN